MVFTQGRGFVFGASLVCRFVRSVVAFWFATPRTPPLWQRVFFLVNCFVLRSLLASERSGVVKTFRCVPLDSYAAKYRRESASQSFRSLPLELRPLWQRPCERNCPSLDPYAWLVDLGSLDVRSRIRDACTRVYWLRLANSLSAHRRHTTNSCRRCCIFVFCLAVS